MRPLIRSRVTNAATAAVIAGIAGTVALVATVLTPVMDLPAGAIGVASNSFAGTIANAGFITELVALPLVMLGCYELGGVTPLWPARISLAGGILGSLVRAALLLAEASGTASIDIHAQTLPLAALVAATVAVGLWVAGAPPLAGPWMPTSGRLTGALAGAGLALAAIGPFVGDQGNLVVLAGEVAFLVLFPTWAFLVARVFRRQAG